MATLPCEIIFNNPYKVYFAGETVTGRVEVIFNKPRIITGIYLNIKAETKIIWSQGSNEDKKYITKEYFNTESFLVGGTERDEITLPPGKHIYPFSQILQSNLPTSIEGNLGHTRYTVQVNIERLWKWNHTVQLEFTVIGLCNLNEIPKLKESATVSTDRYFCCLCCKSGPISCSVKIPKTGFVSGETLALFIELDNPSRVKITNIYLHFEQIVKYFKAPYKDGHKTEKKNIEKVTLGSLMPRDSKNWAQRFSVPSLPPSTRNRGLLIQIHYELTVEVTANILHEDTKLVIPIIIGTTPITDNVSALPKLTASTSEEPPTTPSNLNEPTLSFGENKVYSEESTDFKPCYPIYNFNNN